MRHSFSVQGQIEFFHSSSTQMCMKNPKYVRHCRVDCGLISSLSFVIFFPCLNVFHSPFECSNIFTANYCAWWKIGNQFQIQLLWRNFGLPHKLPAWAGFFLFFPWKKKNCCINHSIITINKSISSIANFYAAQQHHHNKVYREGFVCCLWSEIRHIPTQQNCRWGPRNEWETIQWMRGKMGGKKIINNIDLGPFRDRFSDKRKFYLNKFQIIVHQSKNYYASPDPQSRSLWRLILTYNNTK